MQVERRVGVAPLGDGERARGLVLAGRSQNSPGVSPGAGIIGATSTMRETSPRAVASGALKAPMDCATSTTSL